MRHAIVTGTFDDLRSRDVRFLEEASKFGPLHVLLDSDHVARGIDSCVPKFSQAERQYFLESIRYVSRITLINKSGDSEYLPEEHVAATSDWVVNERNASEAAKAFCYANGLGYQVISDQQLRGFPTANRTIAKYADVAPKIVLVTGSYDWFHSGHIRFFEEVSALGLLYVVVGHDANILLLKGDGHPMFSEDERRYMAGSIRFVEHALISTGNGWLDAEPEIEKIRPDIYAVNEDGDRPEKRDYCQAQGIEYRVLKRRPKPGLQVRQSTDLRGF